MVTPGIYTMTEAEYHADPCETPSLSSSIAAILCSSTPAHARLAHRRLNPHGTNDEAEHFDIGNVAHSILLEGISNLEVLDFPDWRTRASQNARDEARKAGKTPMLRKVWRSVEAMSAATRAQLDAHADGRRMFRDGTPEKVLIWQEANGVWCRSRVDWLRTGAIDDFKTTSVSANPERLQRTVFGSWDIQAAFYRRGVKVLTGEDVDFRFAVQECFAPYALSVVSLGPDAMMLAEKKVQHALEVWAACLEDDNWPAYSTRTAYIGLPPWIENAWLEKEMRDAV